LGFEWRIQPPDAGGNYKYIWNKHLWTEDKRVPPVWGLSEELKLLT